MFILQSLLCKQLLHIKPFNVQCHIPVNGALTLESSWRKPSPSLLRYSSATYAIEQVSIFGVQSIYMANIFIEVSEPT